ncbi:hypothetical protein LAV60_07315 [Clostridium sporogenes]|uniref:Uncharacterized protein n=3 Tax=Clostridium TaxID=1485 RepID=A0A0D1C153_CLOBO|nr:MULTISPECIES: hypothetical protein [Clostridium]MBE6078709.1 hypothetical protein [Clostridium lundense]MDU2832716.1 hypothetical protein [Clostridium botulinum]KIS24806.1 hypothetical protein N495_14920 [Clostridium botulinum B2 450]MCW6092983.1 hypothetical protein [Clostridium sporogenes]MDU4546136.1 hypothetical protein [Clostridium botulinum]
MLVKGTCAKKDLMTEIYKAILSPGSNWTEISSNKINDYVVGGNDGWIFKSPQIGYKKENIFMRLKSPDLSNPKISGNHLYIWLSDNYIPSNTTGENGTFTKLGMKNRILFTPSNIANHNPDTLYNYYVDILDYRILIIIELHTVSMVTYPNFIYVGYPDINTNLEGEEYTNQIIAASNLGDCPSNTPRVYWHKAPGSTGNGSQYNKFAKTFCSLNLFNPNPMGLYLLNPIYLMADNLNNNVPNTGFLGILDGIYGLPNTNIVNGDIVKIDNDQYKIFNIGQYLINQNKDYEDLGEGRGINYFNSLQGVSCIAIKI